MSGTNNFGKHVMLDCSKCSFLDDVTKVYSVLDTLPDMLGMTKIIPPYVFPYSGKVPEDKGITGIVIIAESHITIHTFTEKDFMFVDVFSCVNFDVKKVVDYIITAFDVKVCDSKCVDRGKGFPQQLSTSRQEGTKNVL